MAEFERMHTVPAGYLAAFADPKARRRHVWRFERGGSEPKCLSVKDICHTRNIYAVQDACGNRDPVIEKDLLQIIDSRYCIARDRLQKGGPVLYDDCHALSQFIAYQLVRTDRAFQLLRDQWRIHSAQFEPDDPQRQMVTIASGLERLLWLLSWEVRQVADDDVLITTGNPATMWADRGSGPELGVGFSEPGLLCSLPMTPRLCFVAAQTKEALDASKVLASAEDKSAGTPVQTDLKLFTINRCAVHELNLVHLSNGDRYAISSYDDARLRRFVAQHFQTDTAPVRRSDHRPVGSSL